MMLGLSLILWTIHTLPLRTRAGHCGGDVDHRGGGHCRGSQRFLETSRLCCAGSQPGNPQQPHRSLESRPRRVPQQAIRRHWCGCLSRGQRQSHRTSLGLRTRRAQFVHLGAGRNGHHRPRDLRRHALSAPPFRYGDVRDRPQLLADATGSVGRRRQFTHLGISQTHVAPVRLLAAHLASCQANGTVPLRVSLPSRQSFNPAEAYS